MGNQHRQKSDQEYARKRHPDLAETEDLLHSADPTAALSPNAITQLQRTIGNQAVQRLINGDMQHNTAVLQRQPKRSPGRTPGPAKPGGGTEKEASLPLYLAIITGGGEGKFKGESRIAGHEGEIEILALDIHPTDAESRTGHGGGSGTGQHDTGMTVSFTKYVDSSSPQFLRAMNRGVHLSTAAFQRIRSDPRGGIKVMRTMEFSDGRVTSYTMNGIDPDTGNPVEQIVMEFPTVPS
jgi:type VI secretion system Hcp family effector